MNHQQHRRQARERQPPDLAFDQRGIRHDAPVVTSYSRSLQIRVASPVRPRREEGANMRELWETFRLEPVPEVTDLDRQTFEARHRGALPVVIRRGASAMRAVALWDAQYLAARAGDATVQVASYDADRRDFGKIRLTSMALAQFLADLGGEARGQVRYLFNHESCIFARNETRPELHVGWAASPNLGLAPLAADFPLPGFIDPELFVLAVIILGSQENATDLHYDHGGEGKVLVQVRGRKRILLLPPESAEDLRLHTLFRTPGDPTGTRPQVDVHAAAHADAPTLAGYQTELAPGDIVYWPPFWFHDVANLDPFTLAAGIMLDEIRLSAMLLRHLSHGVFRALVDAARNRAPRASRLQETSALASRVTLRLDRDDLGTLTELFRDLERKLLSEARRGTSHLWEWNARLG
jgi:hypothetical protein